MKFFDYFLLNHIADKHSDDAYKAMKRIEREKTRADELQKSIGESVDASPLGYIAELVCIGGCIWCFFSHPIAFWIWFYLFCYFFFVVAHHRNFKTKRKLGFLFCLISATLLASGFLSFFRFGKTVAGIVLFVSGIISHIVLSLIIESDDRSLSNASASQSD